MDTIVISIDEKGFVSKTKLLEIHYKIKEGLRPTDDNVGLKYGFYIVRVYEFLQSLKPIESKNILDLFKQDINVKVSLEKLVDYISVAREYIKITLLQKQNIVCPSCDTMLIVEKVEGELICEECGFVYDTRLPGLKDIESINTCRSYYSLKANLLRAISKFEGKQTSMSKDDMASIRNELHRRQINVHLLKTEHLLSLLKDLKLEKYYDEVYSLLPILSQKTRQSIHQYIPQILKLHDELEHAYTFVKNPTRINSLNVYFKLYKLLKLCDKNLDVSDLCTLKTEQKFEEHEEKWKEICKITGWEF